ncbi:MAG: DUF4139 domain-containing protein [Magnetospirillum gryphiswaldense]|nr:DUF4139 domain-containing protein [Magnetospirillum gryphiswaldense]
MPWRQFLLATIALSPLAAAAGFADTLLDNQTRTGLTLTITQSDVALVRDRRNAHLEAGDQALVIEPLPKRAELGAAGLTASGLVVRSQQVDVGGIDSQALLAAHRGKEVTVVWRGPGGAERQERATVLSAEGQPVFAIGGKVVTGQPERVVYDTLPPGLNSAPGFRADISVEKSGKRDLDLSYLTHGLGWKPAYVVELADGKATLSAWAEITNVSGGDFPAARIRVLAGQVANDAPLPAPRGARMEKALMAAAMDSGPDREVLGPHYLYTLDRPVNLTDGQSVQVPLIAPLTMSTETRLELSPLPPHAWVGRFAADRPLHPQAVVALKNTSGQPLPAGPARLFQRSADGALAFSGQDLMPMVPAGAPFRLSLGQAFDVTAQRVQTDVQKVSADVTETAWEVRLKNGGDSPAKVLVNEAFAGEWLVLEESLRHEKRDASHAGWSVQVPGKGEAVLRYRVRIKL